jgi:hypothetical protein
VLVDCKFICLSLQTFLNNLYSQWTCFYRCWFGINSLKNLYLNYGINVFLWNKCIFLTCQIFLRVFPCTIIFLKANIFLFSASQNSCSFWTTILFFATRRIWADIRRVIQPIRLQNSSYTVNDYIIILYRLYRSRLWQRFNSFNNWGEAEQAPQFGDSSTSSTMHYGAYVYGTFATVI